MLLPERDDEHSLLEFSPYCGNHILSEQRAYPPQSCSRVIKELLGHVHINNSLTPDNVRKCDEVVRSNFPEGYVMKIFFNTLSLTGIDYQ